MNLFCFIYIFLSGCGAWLLFEPGLSLKIPFVRFRETAITSNDHNYYGTSSSSPYFSIKHDLERLYLCLLVDCLRSSLTCKYSVIYSQLLPSRHIHLCKKLKLSRRAEENHVLARHHFPSRYTSLVGSDLLSYSSIKVLWAVCKYLIIIYAF